MQPGMSLPAETTRNLEAALEKYFSFSAFKTGQVDAIHASLSGRDCVVIMPTGSGKSLCYQLSALMLPGLTLVVSPLIALMKDQVDALEARGLPATFLNSSLNWDEMRHRLDAMARNTFKLVYVAPERFQNQAFRERLRDIDVSLVAVDEAHCISQWGHDFRPDYLRLRPVLAAMPQTRIMALTATATPDVRADIVEQLGLGATPRKAPLVAVHGFERPNLHLAVTRTSTHQAKLGRILDVLDTYPTGIVYASTRKQVERVQALLKAEGRACEVYHGGMADTDRKRVQDRFMSGKAPVVAATNAFGMGVDRGDLRTVMHWDIPGSLEAYYQEVGRAGRDGAPAWCELLFNYADVRTQEFFLEGANPTRAQVQSVWDLLRRSCADEPVQCTVAEWASHLPGAKNEMMVRTALALLERVGLIQRQRSGTESYTTRLAPGADLADLGNSFQYLDKKKERDRRKLDTMLRYVDARTCRHAFILAYFGEQQMPARCENCDRCARRRSAGQRPLSEEQWLDVQKALSCVARMDGRFGIGRVAQVLAGSQARPVVDRGLDRLSTFGLFSERGERFARELLDALLQDGCIEIGGNEYPLACLTERGRKVMQRQTQPSLVWPTSARATAPLTKKASRSAPAVSAADAPLLQALKQWRTKQAKAAGKPAYTVLQDRTLAELAARRPETWTDLESIPGIGPAKLARYGEALLSMIAGHPGRE